MNNKIFQEIKGDKFKATMQCVWLISENEV